MNSHRRDSGPQCRGSTKSKKVYQRPSRAGELAEEESNDDAEGLSWVKRKTSESREFGAHGASLFGSGTQAGKAKVNSRVWSTLCTTWELSHDAADQR